MCQVARSQLLMLCNGIFNEIMTEDIMRINDNIMGIYHQANMIWGGLAMSKNGTTRQEGYFGYFIAKSNPKTVIAFDNKLQQSLHVSVGWCKSTPSMMGCRGLHPIAIHTKEIDIWLVVWNINFVTFHILGMSSSQLTNSIIFQRGRYTTNQSIHFCWMQLLS